MNVQAKALLLRAAREPESALELGPGDWDLLLCQARRARLLARLGVALSEAGLWDRIPEPCAEQLASALVAATYRHRLARFEVDRLQRALPGVPIILLKGCAYLFAELPPARGRGFSDVDIMVPRSRLEEVESQLSSGGWKSLNSDPYDQRYFRDWMHELPPMRHERRQMEVDIHHTIVPPTSRLNPEPHRFWDGSVPIVGGPLKVLAPADMILHSAVHLFFSSEFDSNLRDVVDIDDLLRHFGTREEFWETLVPRASELGLQRPLWYALHFAERLLGSPIPDDVRSQAEEGAPNGMVRYVMGCLIPRGLLPDHPDHPRATTASARWLLYVRSHWLRMPPFMLARHLFHKAFISPKRGNR